MNDKQTEQAKSIMKRNLASHNDWIVLNQTMFTLTKWSISDIELKEWLFPHLLRLTSDKRKSVAGRAEKMIDKLKK
ncbi:hypothetical protein [Tenacibaculum aiptasiae]|uniref:hypothetical protein n=1 Tax=Tenacibaculum aiptasiae TaxID=426481 RepID=UPI00232C8AAE|nr:hypothetical protein [Tenacibaculum aiptasiae]